MSYCHNFPTEFKLVAAFNRDDYPAYGEETDWSDTTIFVWLRARGKNIEIVVIEAIELGERDDESRWSTGLSVTMFTKTIRMDEYNPYDMNKNIDQSTMTKEISTGENEKWDRSAMERSVVTIANMAKGLGVNVHEQIIIRPGGKPFSIMDSIDITIEDVTDHHEWHDE